MSSKAKENETPLPLADTLRDLAALRAAGVDLARVLPEPGPEPNAAVARSYAFVEAARAALRLQQRDELAQHGERVERVRGGLEEILHGLAGAGADAREVRRLAGPGLACADAAAALMHATLGA